MPLQHSTIKNNIHITEQDFSEMWNLKRSKVQKHYIISGEIQSIVPPEYDRFIDWVNNLKCGNFDQFTVNWYPNGRYYLKEHKTQSSKTIIISLGSTIFRVKRNSDSKEADLMLTDGDVVAMTGSFQEDYTYQIPEQVEVITPRITLTFYQFDSPISAPVGEPESVIT